MHPRRASAYQGTSLVFFPTSSCCLPLILTQQNPAVFQEEFLVRSATPQLPCLRSSGHQVAPVSLLSSPLLRTTWNTHRLLKFFISTSMPHAGIHMGVALQFKGNRSFLKSYEEHFPGQIIVDTRQASWSQQVGMAALAEVQPARLQSFVSTCLSMLTSRGSHLKIVIQMQFPVVPERRWLLSHCHIWVLPLRCHPAALGTQTVVSSTASCLFVAGAQLNFWNPGWVCVYS